MTATDRKGPHWIAAVADLTEIPSNDLISAKAELRQKVLSIESQLGASSEAADTTLPGEREWRRRAKIALRMSVAEIDRIKVEMARRQRILESEPRTHRRAIDVLTDIVESLTDIAVPLTTHSLLDEAREIIRLRTVPNDESIIQ